MASALVTIVGTIKDNDSDTEKQVTISGLASIIGLYPGSPPPRPHPEPPLGFWGPNDPRPGYWVPGAPGAPGYKPPGPNDPPGFWGPPGPWIGWWVPGAPGAPGHPGDGEHEPLFEKKVAWTPETGWTVVFVPTGEHVTPSK